MQLRMLSKYEHPLSRCIAPVYFDMDKKIIRHQSSYINGTLIFLQVCDLNKVNKKVFQAQTSTTYQFKTFLIGNTFSVK